MLPAHGGAMQGWGLRLRPLLTPDLEGSSICDSDGRPVVVIAGQPNVETVPAAQVRRIGTAALERLVFAAAIC